MSYALTTKPGGLLVTQLKGTANCAGYVTGRNHSIPKFWEFSKMSVRYERKLLRSKLRMLLKCAELAL